MELTAVLEVVAAELVARMVLEVMEVMVVILITQAEAEVVLLTGIILALGNKLVLAEVDISLVVKEVLLMMMA